MTSPRIQHALPYLWTGLMIPQEKCASLKKKKYQRNSCTVDFRVIFVSLHSLLDANERITAHESHVVSTNLIWLHIPRVCFTNMLIRSWNSPPAVTPSPIPREFPSPEQKKIMRHTKNELHWQIKVILATHHEDQLEQGWLKLRWRVKPVTKTKSQPFSLNMQLEDDRRENTDVIRSES